MTTKISKFLTVFVTLASVALMAVAMANFNGPNWRLKAAEVKEAEFDRANPEAPWTAKRRTDKTDLGGGPNLPAAIVAAQKKLTQEERTAQTDLDQRINGLKSAITTAKALMDVDLDAMKRQQAALDQEFAQLQEQLNQVSQNAIAESKKQIDDLDTLKARADEYIRIKNQLAELRAQREQATEEQTRLKALLYQAKSNLERAQQRRTLLQADGAEVEKYEDGGAE